MQLLAGPEHRVERMLAEDPVLGTERLPERRHRRIVDVLVGLSDGDPAEPAEMRLGRFILSRHNYIAGTESCGSGDRLKGI